MVLIVHIGAVYQALKAGWSTQSTLFMATKYELNQSYNNSKCVSNLLDTTNWVSFLDTSTHYGQYAIGGPTLEMWCESWNNAVSSDAKFKKIYARDTNTYGYYVSSDSVSKQYDLYMNGATSGLSPTDLSDLGNRFPMYFPHVAAYQGCYGYWLASPSAYSNLGSLMYVYYSGGVDYNYYDNDYLGLRPVVCLNSGVSATKGTDGVWQLSK